MSRRPSTAGRGAAAGLAASAESAVPLPQLPIARTAGKRRLPKALAFGVFMGICGALWEAAPAFVSWLLSRPLPEPVIPQQMLTHLLLDGGVQDSQLAFNLRIALVVSVLAVVGFICSYRASAAARPIAALDNGAC